VNTQVQKGRFGNPVDGDAGATILPISVPKPMQKLPDWMVSKSGAWSSQAVLV